MIPLQLPAGWQLSAFLIIVLLLMILIPIAYLIYIRD